MRNGLRKLMLTGAAVLAATGLAMATANPAWARHGHSHHSSHHSSHQSSHRHYGGGHHYSYNRYYRGGGGGFGFLGGFALGSIFGGWPNYYGGPYAYYGDCYLRRHVYYYYGHRYVRYERVCY